MTHDPSIGPDDRTLPVPPPTHGGPAEDLSSEWVLRTCSTVEVDGVPRPALGRYAIFARLGRGGMGVVYFGLNPRLGREVAIKTLPRDLEERHPGLAERFLREARLAARLSSEHLVGVLDVDRDEASGVHFLVMEYVRGISARDWALGLHRAGTPVPEAQALEVVLAAVRGLEVAHLAGVVHRDVKPDNILIPSGPDGRPDLPATKLSDLGLARTDEGGQSLTGTDVTLGTPGYMAPEQVRDVKRARKPSDVFGTGATLYMLLAGEAPFRGENSMQTILATLENRTQPIEEIRGDLSRATVRLLARCLDPDPARRFPDASALRRGLEICLEAAREGRSADRCLTDVIDALVESKERGRCVGSRLSPRGRRVVAAVLALLAVLGAGVLQRGSGPESEPAPGGPAGPAPRWLELAPVHGAVVPGEVVVRGRIEGGAVDRVEAEGMSAVPAADGSFEFRVDLPEGARELAVVARGPSGVVLEARRSILVDRTPPAIEVESPPGGARVADRRVRLTGRARDEWPTRIRVRGVEVAVAADGSCEVELDLAAGANDIAIVAVDAAGNERALTWTVHLDVDGPRIEFEGGGPPAVVGSPRVRLCGTVEDPAGATLAIGGRTCHLEDAGFETVVELADGQNRIELDAVDGAGNRTRLVRTIRLDREAPELEVEEPAEGACVSTPRIAVRGRAADETAVRVVVGETALPVADGAFAGLVPVAPGEQWLRFVATDEAGNERAVVRRVLVDVATPTLEVSSPAAGAQVRGPVVEIAGRLVDLFPSHVVVAGRRVELAADGSFRAVLRLADGPAEVPIEGFDRAGNSSGSSALAFSVDGRGPVVQADPLPAFYEAGPIDLGGTVDEVGCRIEVAGTAATVEGLRWRARVEVLGRGPLEVVAHDAVGNEAKGSIQVDPAFDLGVVKKVDANWSLVLVTAAAPVEIAPGRILLVRREGADVGRVRVEKVLPRAGGETGLELSTSPEPGTPATDFRPGDRVYRRGEP